MKHIVIAAVFALLGLFAGSTVTKYFARQHQHATSVMWLTQFHLDRFSTAVRANNCSAAAQESQALQFFSNEITAAFPLADSQDREFHKYLQELQESVKPPEAVAGQCMFNAAMFEKIRDACDACHRDYR